VELREKKGKEKGEGAHGGPSACADVANHALRSGGVLGVVLLRSGTRGGRKKQDGAAGAYRRRAEVAGGASAGGGGSRAVQGHVQRLARRRLPPVAAPPEGSLPAAVPCQQQRRRAPADLDDVESRVRTSRRRGARWNEEGRQGTPELGAIIPATRR
jgi:hypothetical protein